MDEHYEKHLKVIQVEDGKYYNNKEIPLSLQYFLSQQAAGEVLDDLFPYFVQIYDNISNTSIQGDAARLMLNIGLKVDKTDEILNLAQRKSYSQHSLFVTLKKMTAEGVDIEAFLGLIMTLAEKEVYSAQSIFLEYFNHPQFAETRRKILLPTVRVLVENEAKVSNLSQLVHNLLFEHYPEEDINIQKAWIQHSYYSGTAIGNLRSAIPKYIDLLKDVIDDIKQIWQTQSEIIPYSANEFLLYYAYYLPNEQLLKELLTQSHEYMRRICYTQLGVLSKADAKKGQYFLHYFLAALKIEDDWLLESLSLSLAQYFNNKVTCSDTELSGIFEGLQHYSFQSPTLSILKSYGSASEANKMQLLRLLENATWAKLPLVQGLVNYFNSAKEKYCPFCSNQPQSQSSDFPKNKDEYLKPSAVTWEDTSLLQCQTCEQYYTFYDYVEYDVNSAHQTTILSKTNPAELLKYKLSPEWQESLEKNYDSALNKALEDFYAPFMPLREAAAHFLLLHYIQKQQPESLLQLLKNCTADVLKPILEKYRYSQYVEHKVILRAADLLPFLAPTLCREEAARLITQLYMLEENEAAILGLLNDNRVVVKLGTISALSYSSLPFVPSQQLLQAVYQCGNDFPKECDYIVSHFLPKYDFASEPHDKQSMLQVLEDGQDMNAVLNVLRLLNAKVERIDSLSDRTFEQLIKYTGRPELSYHANALIKNLLEKNKLSSENLQRLLQYITEHAEVVGSDFWSTVFNALAKEKEASTWLPAIAKLLKHPQKEIAKQVLPLLLSWAEKQVSIEPCVADLLALLNSMASYENERIVFALALHYYYHHPQALTSFIDSLPNEMNKGQAISRLADLAFTKKDLSLYYKWLTEHIFATDDNIRERSSRALHWVLRFRSEETDKIMEALNAVVSNRKDIEVNELFQQLKNW